MSIFNTAANLQYESTVGGLPGWVFMLTFIVMLLYLKFGATYNDFETGEPKRYGWVLASIVALFTTLGMMIADWFRKSMFKARTNLYRREGFANAKGAAYQAQRMNNISDQISALKK